MENLHILLFNVEDLYESGKFNGPEERFFALVEKSAGMLPVSNRTRVIPSGHSLVLYCAS